METVVPSFTRIPKTSILLSALMTMLGEREVTSVFCEGGSALAGSLIRERLADKIVFTVAPVVLGDGIPALSEAGIGSLDDAVRLSNPETETIDGDIIITGYPEYNGGLQ